MIFLIPQSIVDYKKIKNKLTHSFIHSFIHSLECFFSFLRT